MPILRWRVTWTSVKCRHWNRSLVEVDDQAKSLSLVAGETGLAQVNDDSPLSQAAARLQSSDPAERCEALMNLSQLGE